MASRDTSIKAYNSIKSSGIITGRRMEIYTCLYQFGPLTASQVFKKLGLETNQSGRFTELKEMGAICEKGKVVCPITKSDAILWDATDNIPTKLNKRKKPTLKDKKNEILKAITEMGKKIDDPVKSQLRDLWYKVDAL